MEHLPPSATYTRRILFTTERKSVFLRYSFALISVLVVLIITLVFEDFFATSPYLLFWAATSLSAFYGGFGPGLLAAVLSSTSVSFFFFSPTFSLYASLDDFLRLLISITIAILISTLYEARKRAAKRLIQIQAVTARLSEAVTAGEIARVVLDHLAGAEEVQAIAVGLCSHENNNISLSVKTAEYAPGDLAERYQAAVQAGQAPLSTTLKTKQPQWIENYQRAAGHFPGLAAVLRNSRLASLPMVVNDKLIGTIDLVFNRSGHFDEETIAYLRVLVHEYAQAFARARLYEAESAARREAEKANALKTQFLGMISHELRTPLTAIKGFATTLLAEDIEFSHEDQRQFAGIIDYETDRLGDLIDQLLDLSQIQAGVFKIRPECCLLQDVVAESRSQLQTLSTQHVLVVTLPEDLPALEVDLRRVSQVLVNLVGNAARYSPKDTIIQISGSLTDSMVRIDVSDQGPGIAPEQHKRIFEVFQRGEAGARTERGAGLGLAISHGIIEAHKGRIWVQEHSGPGTTISFTLPICQED